MSFYDNLRSIVPESAKVLARRYLGPPAKDYRGYLFDDLVAELGGVKPARVLEIGPKDGKDTARLLSLDPGHLLLVDLEDKKPYIDAWLPALARPNLELRYGNVMYDAWIEALEPFDVVWCTGVLYHNPEQLRMLAKLRALLAPRGVLVVESATARRRSLRDENCVEIWYPPPQGAIKKRYHISSNVTHVPSRKAIESWLHLVGFDGVRLSDCHRQQSRALARTRAAFLARRGETAGGYYGVGGHDFAVGLSR